MSKHKYNTRIKSGVLKRKKYYFDNDNSDNDNNSDNDSDDSDYFDDTET